MSLIHFLEKSSALVKTMSFIALLGYIPWSHANADKFYANAELQKLAPSAFALSMSNRSWLQSAHAIRARDAQRFVKALRDDAKLFSALKQWPTLSFDQRMALLPGVFKVECKIMAMVCPQLVINNRLYPTRAVNFVFDVRYPGSGLVFLNPDKLKTMAMYAPLAFLIHETRHAYQFQMAFSQDSLLATGYKEAFKAQATLSGFSFSDFLTLLNEYEAFQFGNHVIGLLTQWKVDMTDMGTFASQFDQEGELKIDLIDLADLLNDKSLLDRYNEHAAVQYHLRHSE